jgi:hypothetical protein
MKEKLHTIFISVIRVGEWSVSLFNYFTHPQGRTFWYIMYRSLDVLQNWPATVLVEKEVRPLSRIESPPSVISYSLH